jgi:hypothetical protein
MGPNSRIAISKYQKDSGNVQLVNLTFGKVRTVFQGTKTGTGESKPRGEPPFRIRTQSAVIGVRGTDFYTKFEPNSGLTQQATLSGEVEVSQRRSRQAVTVKSGQQVNINAVGPVSGDALKEESMAEVSSMQAEGSASDIKPLIVETISSQLVEEIQDTSLLAKLDKEFTSEQAVRILGAPKTWKEKTNVIPPELEEIKNEF